MLVEIKRLARLGRVIFRTHAYQRMSMRGVFPHDVYRALGSAVATHWQSDHKTWRVVGGVDSEGDELTIIVDLLADVVVITVF